MARPWKANVVSIDRNPKDPEMIDVMVHYENDLSSMEQTLTVPDNMPQEAIQYLITKRVAGLEKIIAEETDHTQLLGVEIEGVLSEKVFTK